MKQSPITIRLSTPFPQWPWPRQLPGPSHDRWGNCRFVFNETEGREIDFWVVYEGVSQTETANVSKENTLLITGEPPSIKRYSPRFIQQFGSVITCHLKMKHPRAILSQQALPWHIGKDYGFNYDDFKKNISASEKSRLISMVVSSKGLTQGHRERLRFLDCLRAHFGEGLEIFGRGIRPVADKWDAIHPFKYHIVLENSSVEDYWTEKLSDCFLGGSFPFFSGCPNLEKYFSHESFCRISIKDPDKAIDLIEEGIANRLFEKSADALEKSKNLVLDQYNLYAVVARWAEEKMNDQQAVAASAKTEWMIEPEFSGLNGLLRKGINRWVLLTS